MGFGCTHDVAICSIFFHWNNIIFVTPCNFFIHWLLGMILLQSHFGHTHSFNGTYYYADDQYK